MNEIINEIKKSFTQGSMSTKIVLINVAVFILTSLISIFIMRSNSWEFTYLYTPACLTELITHPWTLITYMFSHSSFSHSSFTHIALNMLFFFWASKIFAVFYTQRDLVGLYLLGGIGGALAFILTFNIFIPENTNNQYLVGASGSITAITTAIAFTSPSYEVKIPLIGNIKVLWIALFLIIMSILNINGQNTGGQVAHLGGALTGYLFSFYYKKGINIVSKVNSAIDWIVNLFKFEKKQPIFKAERGGKTTQQNNSNTYEKSKEAKTKDEIDIILAKVKQGGYDSLTKEEKAKLFGTKNR